MPAKKRHKSKRIPRKVPAQPEKVSYLDEPNLPLRTLAHWLLLDLKRADGMIGGRDLADCVPKITATVKALLDKGTDEAIDRAIKLWEKTNAGCLQRYQAELASRNVTIEAFATQGAGVKADEGHGASADDMTKKIVEAMRIKEQLEKQT